MDTNINVLIVDDYNTMLRIIRTFLRQIGFKNISEANNGEEALEKLRTGYYGLVISDWNMSPMSGLELVEAVRADAALAHLPFILVTAEGKAEKVVAPKAAGGDNYIVKPFNPATRARKISAVLKPRAADG
ncbi:MAG: response regulator [Pseudomonadota bacterium]|nr:response regulator [Pseudomonadota bacterium]